MVNPQPPSSGGASGSQSAGAGDINAIQRDPKAAQQLLDRVSRSEQNTKPTDIVVSKVWREAIRAGIVLFLFLNFFFTLLLAGMVVWSQQDLQWPGNTSESKGLDKTKSIAEEEEEDNKNLIDLGTGDFILLVPQEQSKAPTGSKDLINLIWTSQVTLISGALGFYFGSKGKDE